MLCNALKTWKYEHEEKDDKRAEGRQELFFNVPTHMKGGGGYV